MMPANGKVQPRLSPETFAYLQDLAETGANGRLHKRSREAGQPRDRPLSGLASRYGSYIVSLPGASPEIRDGDGE